MPHKAKRHSSDEPYQQLPLDFDTVINSAQVFSREEVVARSHADDSHQDYDPVVQTTGYMQRAVQLEEAWETALQKAREALLCVDARELYFDFFTDLKHQIEQNSPKAARLADLLDQVAIRGFGMTRNQVRVERPAKGGTRLKVEVDSGSVQTHLETHIVGEHFLNPVVIDDKVWQDLTPLIGASDVSQHRDAVPVPARCFKRKVPFILNNAAGTLFETYRGSPKYNNLFNPKPDEALLRWMLIDPSYQDELESEDYQRCLASAMDVGQYKFDLEYLLKADKRTPNIIFRDGSLFPQDAYLDNFIVESKRGEFTREAIREMLACLSYAREVGIIYCGVSKNVQLKVYSAVIDWFIAKYIDKNWDIGNYTLNDGQAMSLLLASPSFVGNNLQQAGATCLIRRSFTTRANFNTKPFFEDLDTYFHDYQNQHQEIGITPFRRLCEIAHLYMFFVGHSKSPQQQLPRYEFFHTASSEMIPTIAQKILSAIQHCGLMNDEDHSFMADSPVTYLIPSVTQQAHLLSKQVGEYIDRTTGQWIMARYHNLVSKII
jgi:hypothetical protein